MLRCDMLRCAMLCCAVAQGRPGIYEEARARMEALLRERGYLEPGGGVRIEGNCVHFILAAKA